MHIPLPLELTELLIAPSADRDTFGVYGHKIEGEYHRTAQIIDNVSADILEQSGWKSGWKEK